MKIENPAETKDAVEAAAGSASGEGAVKEKRRRAWEQWSPDDIAAFFEGLNEFGKDFDAIQNCLHTKSRKKNLVNATNIKNKDQVRHFYYRTWHKISKYLPTPEEGKRMHKELYGLINYGEMWKRLGGFFNDQLYREKLNELVQHGVTSVKIKGKSHRIKTPVCPALKRLQSPGTDPQKTPSLPDRVVLELTPCCNADFLRVQSVAHNPRIRICSESSSPLSNIIQFLTKKWKPRSILLAESLAEEELIVRIAPDTREKESSNLSAGSQGNKKGHKRTLSGQEQPDEPENKAEARSWILETADNLNVGEVYTLCGGTDGRLALTYSWERRNKSLNSQDSSPEQSEDPSRRAGIEDPPSLLRALVSVAKSCLMKVNISAADFQKKNRRPQGMISSSSSNVAAASHLNGAASVEETAYSRSPQSEASPSQTAPSMESPVQFSRMRQRLRRPLRYGSLKRGALAVTLNKMPGPAPKSSRTALMAQPSTVNLTWNAADENMAAGASTSTHPYVVQVRLDGQVPLDTDTPPPSIAEMKMQEAPVSPDRESFLRPPSILLHTPVKSGSQQGWATCSTGPSLPSTPQRLQEWMSILLPNTPEKSGGGSGGAGGGSGGVESSSVRSISFSIPDSLSTYLGDNFTLPTASSHPASSIGEGSTWPTRDGDEISLSSLLNQLVSPAKSTASSRYTDLKIPFDLQSLVADNSVDLTAKFAELAASIAAADAASTSKNRP